MAITPDTIKWIPFIGIFCIIVCGGTNVLNKYDKTIHMIAAIVAFICFLTWVFILNK